MVARTFGAYASALAVGHHDRFLVDVFASGIVILLTIREPRRRGRGRPRGDRPRRHQAGDPLPPDGGRRAHDRAGPPCRAWPRRAILAAGQRRAHVLRLCRLRHDGQRRRGGGRSRADDPARDHAGDRRRRVPLHRPRRGGAGQRVPGAPRLGRRHRRRAGARPVLGHLGFSIVSIGALLATASAINATLFSALNIARALAEKGQLPALFAEKVWARARAGSSGG